MHVTMIVGAQSTHGIGADESPAQARVQTRTHASDRAENLDLVSCCGPSGPSCLFWRRDFGPPPVSPVVLSPIRADFVAIGNRPASRTRTPAHSTNPVERNPRAGWRRRARRYVGLCGASVSSFRRYSISAAIHYSRYLGYLSARI